MKLFVIQKAVESTRDATALLRGDYSLQTSRQDPLGSINVKNKETRGGGERSLLSTHLEGTSNWQKNDEARRAGDFK
ncbi:MAG: hypothetical protein UT02_C0021G0006 [Parcubacteria group bacterium GW2011_GWC2_38_7]|nr:MAG: hypothetical protein UT02_C0021G0006 [Parcubacteria group bacterium GW2011_GWC2_38_7]